MLVVKNLLVAAGVVFLLAAVIDLSLRAAGAGFVLTAGAYAVHRRFAFFWWAVCVFLAGGFLQALTEALFFGPRTGLAIISSVLGMLVAALAFSWWWRQRCHFSPRSDE